MKIIYSSNTGNTEAIAESIAVMLDLETIEVSANPSIEDDEVLFLGCPADGDEVVTDEMLEFIDNHMSEFSGINVLLFGSYSWNYGNDRAGEWLDRFEEAVSDLGANVLGKLKVYDAEIDNDEIQKFVDLAK